MKKLLLLSLLGGAGIVLLGLPLQAEAQFWGGEHGYYGQTKAVENIAVPGAIKGESTEGELVTVIKTFVNWVLGILGLIALGLCLWAGFQMTTAGSDTKKFDEGKTIMKHAGIGLAIIALSRLIVSLIFRVIKNVTDAGTT